MTKPLMSCIQRTCPECGASNTVMTPEVRPTWRINCSRCGFVLVERRGFWPRLVEPLAADLDPSLRDLAPAHEAI